MKRSKALLGIALAVLLVSTGCGKEKVLSCKQSEEGLKMQFDIGFKEDNVSSMSLEYEMDLSSYDSATIKELKKQDFCEYMKEEVDEFKSAYKDCNQKVDGKKMVISVKFDASKLNKEAKKELKSMDAAKKSLEKDGFKCSTK